jgi:hypothetical protein
MFGKLPVSRSDWQIWQTGKPGKGVSSDESGI